jgi:hypothetical protein
MPDLGRGVGTIVTGDNGELAEQLVGGGIHKKKSNLRKREQNVTCQFFSLCPNFQSLYDLFITRSSPSYLTALFLLLSEIARHVRLLVAASRERFTASSTLYQAPCVEIMI